jgi:hypothetical protein
MSSFALWVLELERGVSSRREKRQREPRAESREPTVNSRAPTEIVDGQESRRKG